MYKRLQQNLSIVNIYIFYMSAQEMNEKFELMTFVLWVVNLQLNKLPLEDSSIVNYLAIAKPILYIFSYCTTYNAYPSSSTLFHPISLAKIITRKATIDSITIESIILLYGDCKIANTFHVESHIVTLMPILLYVCLL